MLLRTHLAFGILIITLLINYVNNKFIFIGMALVATILPDIDTGFSNLGDSILFRPLQLFVKHRGIIHSLTLTHVGVLFIGTHMINKAGIIEIHRVTP